LKHQSTSSFLKDPLMPHIVVSLEPTLEQPPNPCFNAETAPSRAFSEYSSRQTFILSLLSNVGFISNNSFRHRSVLKRRFSLSFPTVNIIRRILESCNQDELPIISFMGIVPPYSLGNMLTSILLLIASSRLV